MFWNVGRYMQIIALINQKGGVGKTTCAINIGAGLNKLRKRVLLIDLDPQAHLTYSLGIPAHELKNTVYELLKGTLTLNALTTAQKVYIPLQTEFLALQGMTKLLETITIVKKRLNKNIEIAGIIATRFDCRKNPV